MTTAVMATLPATTSNTGAPAPGRSFSRLLSAEARKLVDTRAGLWLLIAMGVLTVAVTFGNALLMGYVARPGGPVEGVTLHLLNTAAAGAGILGTFLGILAILSVCSEWGQRTALTTFALEPRRGRVLAAKALVVLLIATVLVVLALPLGAAGQAVAHAAFHVPVDYHLSLTASAVFWLGMMLGGPLFGLALGLLLQNSPAAIVTYLVLPIVLNLTSLISLAWKPFAKAVPWIDPATAQGPFMAATVHAKDWLPLLVTTLIWIALPAAIGTWRWMRRECK